MRVVAVVVSQLRTKALEPTQVRWGFEFWVLLPAPDAGFDAAGVVRQSLINASVAASTARFPAA